MRAPLIQHLALHNFLSYGPEGVGVDLVPLNVLIGPNASGKSNLLEALLILRATAGDLQAAIRAGGGIGEYVWKGAKPGSGSFLRAVVGPLRGTFLMHEMEMSPLGTYAEVANETIGTFRADSDDSDGDAVLYASAEGSGLILARRAEGREEIPVSDLNPGQSVLSQRRDPVQFPELTSLADFFRKFVLFQEWNFGRNAAARLPQRTDLPSDFLLPDASNLGLILHDLWQTSGKREELIGYLRKFYEPARFISTKLQGGTIQLYIEEEGERLIPATRLSDGTLRYLCLLAILCHSNPPPVIGIEEPELGLHPDVVPTVAELLRKASERTQLFVTTHSDALVSALSDIPESILVCEATPNGTTMKRLEAEPLREWLEKYTLGEIWRMGEIGGNRW